MITTTKQTWKERRHTKEIQLPPTNPVCKTIQIGEIRFKFFNKWNKKRKNTVSFINREPCLLCLQFCVHHQIEIGDLIKAFATPSIRNGFGLWSVQQDLLLLGAQIVDGEHNFTSFANPVAVGNHRFISWPKLRCLLYNHSIATFSTGRELCPIADIPSYNSQFPNQKAWLQKQMDLLLDSNQINREKTQDILIRTCPPPTSEIGNSTVCLVAALMATSVTGSSTENSCSPSLLNPPYWTGTCSGATYLREEHKETKVQAKAKWDWLRHNGGKMKKTNKTNQNKICNYTLTWIGSQQSWMVQRTQTCFSFSEWRRGWSSCSQLSTTMARWWTPSEELNPSIVSPNNYLIKLFWREKEKWNEYGDTCLAANSG